MTTLALLSLSSSAHAAEYGWGWAYGATLSYEYPMLDAYQYNDLQDANTVIRNATGMYTVYMPQTGTGTGHVQVTAYGSNNAYCKVASWGTEGADRVVEVWCYGPSGSYADSMFDVIYLAHDEWSSSSAGEAGHVKADQPTTSNYNPATQFNSEGLLNSVSRSSTGVYDVRLAGVDTFGGTALVTAYGISSDRCKVAYWGPSGADTVVRVYCHTASGAAVDTAFTLSFAVQTALTNAGQTYGSNYGAYAWTGGSSSGTVSLTADYSWSTLHTTSVGTRTRNSTGRYTVRFYDMGFDDIATMPLVTGYGSGGGYCKVESWYDSGDDAYVNVRCYNASGALADSWFDLTLETEVIPLI